VTLDWIQIVPAILAALLLIVLTAMAVQWWKRRRITPAELERRRRAAVHAIGKLGDAELVDVHGHVIVYSYDVRGVAYTAAQDVASLAHLLPEVVSGPLLVKYDPKNPANSIVLCEEWNGVKFVAR
jgi:hypothetical protein